MIFATMRTLLIVFILSCFITGSREHGPRQLMDDETYDTILRALKGEFQIPVAERSRTQRSALVKLWRNREHYALSEDGKSITFDGKLLPRKSRISEIVHAALHQSKGSGARRLNIKIKEQYSGISRAKVRNALDRSTTYQLHKARFLNKPTSKSIRAKAVQERHQIDLVDMGRCCQVWPSELQIHLDSN